MQKFPSLLLAGLLATSGIAHAQVWSSASTADVPTAGDASTMTDGVPNARTTNSPYPDGTPVVVLQPAVPAVVTASTPVTVTSPVYVVPQHGETWDVPQRSGDASTMTNGVPNMATSNWPAPVYLIAPAS